MISVHDFEPYSYRVAIREPRVVLHTASPDTSRFVDVIFTGVAMFQIAEVNMGQNSLFDIAPISGSRLYDEFPELFTPRMIGGIAHGYDWAPFRYKTKEEFIHGLERSKLVSYILDTSMGLYGFVVCAHANFVERDARASAA